MIGAGSAEKLVSNSLPPTCDGRVAEACEGDVGRLAKRTQFWKIGRTNPNAERAKPTLAGVSDPFLRRDHLFRAVSTNGSQLDDVVNGHLGF
jgi:hypothetical protein